MSNYAILRTSKIKDYSSLHATNMHNSRQWAPDNARADGKVLRILGDADSVQMHKQMMQKFDIKPRSNAVLAIEYLATFSPDMANKISVKEWAKANIEHFKKEHPQGLISVDLHLDEATPHMHIVAAPLIKKTVKGKEKYHLSARDFTGGKEKMIELQNRYAEAMQRFDLERGIKGSVAHHKTIKSFYKTIDAQAKAALLESKKEQPEAGFFNAKALYENAKKEIKKLSMQLSKMLAKITNQAEKIAFLEKEAAYWKHSFQHSSKAKTVEDLKAKVEKLEEKNNRLAEAEFANNILQKIVERKELEVTELKQKTVDQLREIEALKTNGMADQGHSY